MSYLIQLHEGKGLLSAHAYTLASVLRRSMCEIVGRKLENVFFDLQLQPVPLPARLNGKPTLDNLLPDYGYATLTIYKGDQVIYRHPHTVEELVAIPLQELLRKSYPDVDYWGYRIAGPGLPATLARSRPEVEGEVAVMPYADGERPRFQINRIEEPEPTPTHLGSFGVSATESESRAFVKVLIHDDVHRELTKERYFSPDVEEGGFLTGRVFRDRDHEGSFLLEITAALQAEHTGASFLQFTFTGDSFRAMKQTLRKQRMDERLLGWYHTHLFPATDDFGLSTIDFRLHFTTFQFPWQQAGLINVDGDHRTLRFYVRQGDTMELCPHWVVEHKKEPA